MYRLFVLVGAALLFFAFARMPALAITEYCTAQLDVWPSSPMPTSDYLTVLWSDSQHAVAGKILFYTKRGWFAAPIGELQLEPSVSTLRTTLYTNHHASLRSERYAIHFPSDVVIDNIVFAPSGGTLCAAQEPRKIEAASRYGWAPFADELTHAPYVIAALPAAEPGDTNCDQPFKPAVVTAAIAPHTPDIVRQQGVDRSEALVEVAVAADGSLQDAWIFSSSGFPSFDREVMRVARLSRYTPGRSFCRNVPGNYLYRGTFQLP